MKVLVIGGGGREHALAWKLSRSPLVNELHVLPGNPGTWDFALHAGVDHHSIAALADFAEAAGIGLTVVGPEAYLAMGLTDEFVRRELAVFGPSRDAAELETDKSFAKEFMRRWNIPTADFGLFHEYGEAKRYVEERGAPVVVKANGLAGGKGAFVCATPEEALGALDSIMRRGELGKAGECVVIEEYMEGEEASLLVMTDGETALPMLLSQDHKRAADGDLGPNTGGMGAYAPAGVLDADELDEVMRSIVAPTLAGLSVEGRPYRGVLYVGLMKTSSGPRVVEYNCRFGDPEAQAILPLLQSDLAELCLAVANGDGLGGRSLAWTGGSAVCVVLASGGYPGPYRRGLPIAGLEEAGALPGALVFHAGTSKSGAETVTAGGRVLDVIGTGPDIAAARACAYEACGRISFEGMQYRRDIAWREMRRKGM